MVITCLVELCDGRGSHLCGPIAAQRRAQPAPGHARRHSLRRCRTLDPHALCLRLTTQSMPHGYAPLARTCRRSPLTVRRSTRQVRNRSHLYRPANCDPRSSLPVTITHSLALRTVTASEAAGMPTTVRVRMRHACLESDPGTAIVALS